MRKKVLDMDTSISWKPKKQHIVSTSSAEAKYRSMAKITQELIWIKDILFSLSAAYPSGSPLL